MSSRSPRARRIRRVAAVVALALGGGVVLMQPLTTVLGPQQPGPRTVVALGDSVMAGVSCDCAGPAKLVQQELRRRHHHDVALTDLSGGGATTLSVSEQLSDPVIAAQVRSAEAVIIIVGANDVADDVHQDACSTQESYDDHRRVLSTDLGAMLDQLRAIVPGGTRIVLGTYWNVSLDGSVAAHELAPVERVRAAALTDLTNQVIREQARSHSALVADLVPVFHGVDTRRDPTGLLGDDGDHPNAAGAAAIAEVLVNQLELP